MYWENRGGCVDTDYGGLEMLPVHACVCLGKEGQERKGREKGERREREKRERGEREKRERERTERQCVWVWNGKE